MATGVFDHIRKRLGAGAVPLQPMQDVLAQVLGRAARWRGCAVFSSGVRSRGLLIAGEGQGLRT
jgi:hypothetical protein